MAVLIVCVVFQVTEPCSLARGYQNVEGTWWLCSGQQRLNILWGCVWTCSYFSVESRKVKLRLLLLTPACFFKRPSQWGNKHERMHVTNCQPTLFHSLTLVSIKRWENLLRVVLSSIKHVDITSFRWVGTHFQVASPPAQHSTAQSSNGYESCRWT